MRRVLLLSLVLAGSLTPARADVVKDMTPERIREAISVGKDELNVDLDDRLSFAPYRVSDGECLLSTPFLNVAVAAAQAGRRYKEFTEADVTPDMLAPVFTLSCSDSEVDFDHVVLLTPKADMRAHIEAAEHAARSANPPTQEELKASNKAEHERLKRFGKLPIGEQMLIRQKEREERLDAARRADHDYKAVRTPVQPLRVDVTVKEWQNKFSAKVQRKAIVAAFPLELLLDRMNELRVVRDSGEIAVRFSDPDDIDLDAVR